MKRKFYKIDTEIESTLTWTCPKCKHNNMERDNEDIDLLVCSKCDSRFEYDRDADNDKDIYRYELVSK